LQKDYGNAVTEYQEALKSKPDSAQYYRDLGEALAAAGRSDDAMNEYRVAQKNGDNSEELKLCMVKAYKQVGQLGKAKALVDQIVSGNAKNVEAINELAVILMKMDHFPEAAYALKRALELDPDFPQALNNIGIAYYHLNRSDDAIATWRKLIETRPEYPEAHYNLGTVLFEAGEVKKAEAEFNFCLKYSPDDAFAHNNLGLVMMRLDRKSDAIGQWRQAIELNPDLSQAFINLGKALSERNTASIRLE
jgi:Flp pilus assembly protein TadD